MECTDDPLSYMRNIASFNGSIHFENLHFVQIDYERLKLNLGTTKNLYPLYVKIHFNLAAFYGCVKK